MEGSTLQRSPADARVADLYGRYYAQIERYCRARLRDREDAEDAVQSTFLRVTTALRKGVCPELEAPWLYKIAHNVCLSRIARRREAAADLATLEERLAAPDTTRPDRLYGLEDALAEMPENLRRVLLLREWQGLSYAEIAEETGQTQSAVETLIFRARRHLAKALGALGIPWPLKFAAGTAIVAGLAGGGLVMAHQSRPARPQPQPRPAPAAGARMAATPRLVAPARVFVPTIAAQPRQSLRPQVPQTRRSTPRPAVRRVAPQPRRQATVAAAPGPTVLPPVPEEPAAPEPAAVTPAPEPAAVTPGPDPAAATPAPPPPGPAPATAQEQPAVTTPAVATTVADVPAVSVPDVDPPELPAAPDVSVPVTVPAVPALPPVTTG